MISVKKIKTDVSERMTSAMKNVSSIDVLWKRKLKKDYISYQKRRFETNNERNEKWKQLSPEYLKRKTVLAENRKRLGRSRIIKDKRKKVYLTVDEKGASINVLTGELKRSILAKNNEYKELVLPTKIFVSTTVPYAGHVDSMRSISQYDSKFKEYIRKQVLKYVWQQ